MRVDPKAVAGLLKVAKDVIEFARSEDVRDVAQKLWETIQRPSRGGGVGSADDLTAVSRALHRLQTRTPPRLALAGLTSSGKSSLLNTLFGLPVADVKRTADTTDCIICVPFQSGLTICDTPGFAGDETFENVARAFLRIPQDPDLRNIASIPFLRLGQSRSFIDLSEADKRYPIDAVVFLLDLSRTISRADKNAIRAALSQLEKVYDSRLIVVGTHLDVISDSPDRDAVISSFQKVTDDRLTPVSNVTGEGLDVLTQRIFQTLPGRVSLSILQETLLQERKATRLEFVVAEAAAILAQVAFLDGKSTDDLRAYLVLLYVQVCQHYSVGEETWKKLNGDLNQIHTHVAEHGISRIKRERDPEGFWEWFRSRVLGTKFFDSAVEFRRFGTAGLAELSPRVYALIHDLAEVAAPKQSQEGVAIAIRALESSIEPLVAREDAAGVAAIVGERLLSLLRGGVSSAQQS